ncbi:MAG: hypothetical protein ACTSP6_06040 [Promethearchaeota archaeon]
MPEIEHYEIIERMHGKSIEKIPVIFEDMAKKIAKFMHLEFQFESHYLVNEKEEIIGFECEFGMQK